LNPPNSKNGDRLLCCGRYGADRKQEENGVRNSFSYRLLLSSSPKKSSTTSKPPSNNSG
jgi:hypothetical protein